MVPEAEVEVETTVTAPAATPRFPPNPWLVTEAEVQAAVGM